MTSSVSPDLDAVLAEVDRGLDESLERLKALLRIKSISTDPAYASDCRHAAEWLARQVSSERLVSTTFECWAEMRYLGQSFQVDVRLPDSAVEGRDIAAMHDAFHNEHERIYSHADRNAPVEFVDLRMRVRGAMSIPEPATLQTGSDGGAQNGVRSMRFQGRSYPDVPIYDRSRLSLNETVSGPAVIEQPEATLVVPPDFVASVGPYGAIFMTRS
jgi:N-methylhydantoinase A